MYVLTSAFQNTMLTYTFGPIGADVRHLRQLLTCFIAGIQISARRAVHRIAVEALSPVGSSVRDVQFFVGHTSLQTTQRYIEDDSEARMKVVDLV